MTQQGLPSSAPFVAAPGASMVPSPQQQHQQSLQSSELPPPAVGVVGSGVITASPPGGLPNPIGPPSSTNTSTPPHPNRQQQQPSRLDLDPKLQQRGGVTDPQMGANADGVMQAHCSPGKSIYYFLFSKQCDSINLIKIHSCRKV